MTATTVTKPRQCPHVLVRDDNVEYECTLDLGHTGLHHNRTAYIYWPTGYDAYWQIPVSPNRLDLSTVSVRVRNVLELAHVDDGPGVGGYVQ